MVTAQPSDDQDEEDNDSRVVSAYAAPGSGSRASLGLPPSSKREASPLPWALVAACALLVPHQASQGTFIPTDDDDCQALRFYSQGRKEFRAWGAAEALGGGRGCCPPLTLEIVLRGSSSLIPGLSPKLHLPRGRALILCLAQDWEPTEWKQEVRNIWVRLEPRMPIFQELVEGQVSQEWVGSSGMLGLAFANAC